MKFKWKGFYFSADFGTANIKNEDETIKKLIKLVSALAMKEISAQAIQCWPIISKTQIQLAFLLTTEAIKRQTFSAKKIWMEFLTKLLAKKQIKEIPWHKIGIKDKKDIFVFSFGKRKNEVNRSLKELKKILNLKRKNEREIFSKKNFKEIIKFYKIENIIGCFEKRFEKSRAIENAIIENIALSAFK